MSDTDIALLGREHDPVRIIKLPLDRWQEFKALRLEGLALDPHAFASSYAKEFDQPDSFWTGRLASAMEGRSTWLLFAEENDRLVGLMGAYTKVGPDAAEVVAVYVTQSARGRGIGKMLLRALLDELAGSGTIRKASLTVNKDNLPAYSLYTSCGFRVIGEDRAVRGDGKTYEEYLLEKML